MRGKSYKFVKHPQHVGSSLSHDFDVYFGDITNKNATKRGFSYYNVEDNIITVTIPSDADVDSVVNYFCPKHANSMNGTIGISYKTLEINSDYEEYEWFYGNMYPSPGIDLEIYVTGDFETANIFGYDIKNQSVIKTLMKEPGMLRQTVEGVVGDGWGEDGHGPKDKCFKILGPGQPKGSKGSKILRH